MGGATSVAPGDTLSRSLSMPRSALSILTLSFTFMLFACGGGERAIDIQALPEIENQGHGYGSAVYQSPNYPPYATPSHTYLLGDTSYVGGDVEPKENLRHFSTWGEFEIFMGASRDGAGVDRIRNYETDLVTQDGSALAVLSDDGFYPFRVKPRILLGSGIEDNSDLYWALADSVEILNDALPPEFQLSRYWDDPNAPFHEGDILVVALPQTELQVRCSAGAVACATGSTVAGHMQYGTVYIPDDLADSGLSYTRTTFIHELLHALGIWGHVDSIEFPDSLMGEAGDVFPNVGFNLHRVDREALQIMYMAQRTDVYNDFDEWSDTSLHLVGRAENGSIHFGTALFNGLPQPWARGTGPTTSLADNSTLSGTATWRGELLGFSGPSPIGGSVALQVALSRLSQPQTLMFRDLFFINRLAEADSWFPSRDFDYLVNVYGNQFRHTSDDGQIAGVFLGGNHEGMAGTIKRTDLVGAFGGMR